MNKENYKKLKEHYGESKAKNLMHRWRKGLHSVEKQRDILTVCGYVQDQAEVWIKDDEKIFL